MTGSRRHPPRAPGVVSSGASCSAGPHVAVSVEDTGTGIEESHVTLLFEPFFTTKPVGRGTGLGRSTAYGIVRQSGGEIRVDSRLGAGARFDLLSPRILRELGSRVTTAADGVEALELISTRENLSIDLLLTDVVMPRIGGVELAAKLRPKRPNLPVLFFSGYAECSPLPTEGLSLSRRNGFLQKPFTRAELAQRVGELLERED